MQPTLSNTLQRDVSKILDMREIVGLHNDRSRNSSVCV